MKFRKTLSWVMSLVLLIGTVGSLGILTVSAATAADCVTGATLTELNSGNLPTGANLLKGLTPKQGITATNVNVMGGALTSRLTDEVFQGINQEITYVKDSEGNWVFDHPDKTDDSQRWLTTNVQDTRSVPYLTTGSTATSDGELLMTYNLGVTAKITDFVLANSAEISTPTKATVESAGYTVDEHPTNYQKYLYMHMGEFYVSNDLTTLYDAGNKVADWDYLQDGTIAKTQTLSPLAGQYTLNSTVTGQYVGFRIVVKNAWGWSNVARLSELGVYGSFQMPDGSSYSPITSEKNIPDGTNLVQGKLATDVNGMVLSTAGNTALSNLTDGKFQGANATVDYVLTETQTISNSTATYYNYLAPAELVAEQAANGTLDFAGNVVDASKTYYLAPENTRWQTTTTNQSRVLLTYGTKPVFDLGCEADISQITVGSSLEIQTWTNSNTTASGTITMAQITAGRNLRNAAMYATVVHVYASDSRDTLFNGAPVLSYDWSATADRAKALNNAFTLGDTVTARYVGFDIQSPTTNFLRIAELGVYGTASATGFDLSSANADRAILPADSLASGARFYTTVNIAGASNNACAPAGKTDFMSDGLMGGINSVHAQGNDICWAPGSGPVSVASNEWMFFSADLGNTCEIDSVMFCGAGDSNYGVQAFDLFISNSPASALAGDTTAQPLYSMSSKVTRGYRVDFAEAQEGRYVIMRCKMTGNAGNYQMWVSEFAVAGIVPATITQINATTNTDKLIAAEDNILSHTVSFQRSNNATGSYIYTPPVTGNGSVDTAYFWDGIVTGVNADYFANSAKVPCPSTGSATVADNSAFYLSFDLGEDYNVDSIMLSGSGVSGLGVESLSVWVGDNTITDIITNGVKADAAYGSNITYALRADFDSVKTGRYVVMKVGAKANAGNFQTWISEIAAAGSPVRPPKTETKKIVCVGDSITWGAHFNAEVIRNSPTGFNTAGASGRITNNYPVQLEKLLDNASDTIDYTVVNAGISGICAVGNPTLGLEDKGDTCGEWLTRSASHNYVQAADEVLIMLGTNDGGNDWDLRKPLYKQYYEKIINAFRAANPSVEIYVVTSPYTEKSTHYNTLAQDVVPMQIEIAAEMGCKVIDVYTASRNQAVANGIDSFIDADDLELGISVHPSEQGLGLIAGTCFNALTATSATASVADLKYDITGTSADANRVTKVENNLLVGSTIVGTRDGVAYVCDGNLRFVNGDNGNNHSTVTAGEAFVSFDMGSSASVGQILMGGTVVNSTTKTFLLRGYQVYIGDDLAALTAKTAEPVLDVHFTEDDITAAATTVGRLYTLSRAVKGRYMVVFPDKIAASGATNSAWLSEVAAVGTVVKSQTMGAQIRGYVGGELVGEQALRFGSAVTCTGVTEGASHGLVLGADSKISIGGKEFTVTGMGTLIARAAKAGEADMLMEKADGSKVYDVPAAKVYQISGNTVTFTAVVTNVPEGHYGDQLLARAYVEYTDGTDTFIYYGDVISRNVSGLLSPQN